MRYAEAKSDLMYEKGTVLVAKTAILTRAFNLEKRLSYFAGAVESLSAARGRETRPPIEKKTKESRIEELNVILS